MIFAEEFIRLDTIFKVLDLGISICGLGVLVATVVVYGIQAWLLRKQVQEQVRQTKAQTSALLAGQTHDINRILLEYHDVWLHMDEPLSPGGPEQPSDRRILLSDILLNHFEQVYRQRRHESLELIEFDTWLRVMKDTFAKRYIREYWPQVKGFNYDPDFVRFIDEVLLPQL